VITRFFLSLDVFEICFLFSYIIHMYYKKCKNKRQFHFSQVCRSVLLGDHFFVISDIFIK
jgi:hypothetical protein